MHHATPHHGTSWTPRRFPSALAWLLLALVLATIPGLAHALESKPLPYEAGLGSLYTSLTGPVPFIISLVGIVACGAMLIFGGEISGFLRTMVFLVLVISVIVQATAIVAMFGGNWEGQAPGTITTQVTAAASIHGIA